MGKIEIYKPDYFHQVPFKKKRKRENNKKRGKGEEGRKK